MRAVSAWPAIDLMRAVAGLLPYDGFVCAAWAGGVPRPPAIGLMSVSR